MKKRILILNWWDIKNPLAGGAEVYLDEVFSRLAKKNYEITLLCCRYPGGQREETVHGVKIIRISSAKLINLTSFFWYLKHRKKFDIVIDFTNKILYLTPFYLWSKPHIGIALDVFDKILVEEFGILGYFLAFLERTLFIFYRKVNFVSISVSTKQDLIKISIPSNKIKVIYPGMSFDLISKISQSKEPLIVYLGRLKKYKRVDVLLRVFQNIAKLIKKTRLVIIGTGEEEINLKKFTQRLGLGKSVSFLGYVNEKEKADWLKKAWVMVQPSIKEGWGLTVIEAGVQKTPTVAANVPGLRETVIDNKTGWLFDENDLKGFKEKLIRALSNQKEREKFGQNAFEFAKKFSWEKNARELRAEIDRVTRKNK